jgi:hypothetical protein
VDPDDRVYQPMSLRGPAFIVLGIAIVIVVAGVAASIFGTGSAPSRRIQSITIPDGTVVRLTPASQALASIVSGGQPPPDIMDALSVPAASPVTGTVDIDQNVGQFDRTVKFRTGLASGQVVDLYRTLLPKLGWRITYTGPSRSPTEPGTEVLATRGSTDSFYWEVGVVVAPTTSTGTTPFSLEVLESADPF